MNTNNVTLLTQHTYGVCPPQVCIWVNPLITLKEETFAVSRFLAKSAKVSSREIF